MWTRLTVIVLIYFCGIGTSKIVNAESIEQKINLRIYKKDDILFEQTVISEAETLFKETNGYNKSLPIVFLIHGIGSGAQCLFTDGLVEAFWKRRLMKDYNIFAIDMPDLMENSFRNQYYYGPLTNVEPAGNVIGRFFSKVIKLNLTRAESINIIGYSMGGQVAGYVARAILNEVGEKINFIGALDPAGPGFHMKVNGRPTLTHVSAADARITHFYHSNSILCGTRDRVAMADFVFNKGTVQPGCTKHEGLGCSHIRIPELYIESVLKVTSFIARRCATWEKFISCQCNANEVITITFPPDPSAKGIYYLRTRSKIPFALGRKGSRCNRLVHKRTKKHKQTKYSKNTSMFNKIKNFVNPKINTVEFMHEKSKMIDFNKSKVNEKLELLNKQVESEVTGVSGNDQEKEVDSSTVLEEKNIKKVTLT